MQPDPTTALESPSLIESPNPPVASQYGSKTSSSFATGALDAAHRHSSRSPRRDSPHSRTTRNEDLSTLDGRASQSHQFNLDAFLGSGDFDRQYHPPLFMITKGRGTKAAVIRLDQFPNEVLTHILSHLPAPSLSAMACVSRRFCELVTTPHAWRIAFSRYFPGKDALDNHQIAHMSRSTPAGVLRHDLRAEHRLFNRLTLQASWRSEYILRTRLLRSLARGKPAQTSGHSHSSRTHSTSHGGNPVTTYNSQLFSTINHIHAVWNQGKKSPRFIHGTEETGSACMSDPTTAKVDNWGLSDPQALPQFSDMFPGEQPYGLGEGRLIGTPNVMDVSQPYGMIYGEGFPGGMAYFRSSEEMRGRFLTSSTNHHSAPLGIPKVPELTEAISAVWIAKSASVPTVTDGLIGIMTGSSCGIVTTYSLGADNLRDNRLAKGEITARWILSPGVPIIAVAVINCYSAERKAAERVWAVALNALGEIFYLVKTPQRVGVERGTRLDGDSLLELAWDTGRSISWHLIESSQRVARSDPYQTSDVDGSYSPRSSPKAKNLSSDQLLDETREIEKFLSFKPARFQRFCEGWNMRRELEVDFADDDGCGAGENIVVIETGSTEARPAQIQRFKRLKSQQSSLEELLVPKTPSDPPKSNVVPSIFGEGPPLVKRQASAFVSLNYSPNPAHTGDLRKSTGEWRKSNLSWEKLPFIQITAHTIDTSTLAMLTPSEDPLVARLRSEKSHSPSSTRIGVKSEDRTEIPGNRARFLAIGTNTGAVILWNIRGPHSSNPKITNDLHPLRVIWTDSPQIVCLALSALYLVHGGNDGLVQAWDPLASSLDPLKTLNSRFSSRARRRLVQAEASVQGVGINLYAAGAVVLDPDPTVLRGMVSLGTHLRFWSYSSSTGDQISGRKRRIRRSSERGNNGGPERFSNSGRGAIMDYILSEQEEIRKEKIRRVKEETRLRGRFGVGLNGLSDEEAIKYAEMLSQEAFQKEEDRRASDSGYSPDPSGPSSSAQSAWSSETVTPEGSVALAASPRYKTNEELDRDIEKAIRLSILDDKDEQSAPSSSSKSGPYDIPLSVKQRSLSHSASGSPSNSLQTGSKISVSPRLHEPAIDDLELAIRLSLAEEQSRREFMVSEEDEFPVLENEVVGKGKGRAT